jgi:hypothetical protein
LRGEQAPQGQRNKPLPAERTPSLHRHAHHFRIDQRRCPSSSRRPLQDGSLAGLTARKGGGSCAHDRNQQEDAGHGETAEREPNWIDSHAYPVTHKKTRTRLHRRPTASEIMKPTESPVFARPEKRPCAVDF